MSDNDEKRLMIAAQACGDPGSFISRNEGESTAQWSGRAVLFALEMHGELYRGENGAAGATLDLVRPALRDLPTTCRYHGENFDFLGREANGEPRCESCKPAYRATRAWNAVERWYADVIGKPRHRAPHEVRAQ